MRIKALFAAAAAAVLLAVAAPAHAADVKIAHANLQKALNECDAGQKAKEQLKNEAQKLEDELSTRQEELKKLKDEMDKKSSVWNKETKESKEADFRKKQDDFQRLYMDYNQRMNEAKQGKEAVIIRELTEIVEDLAKKKGYTYVFERGVAGLIVAPADADLTDEVIKAHNKRFKGK